MQLILVLSMMMLMIMVKVVVGDMIRYMLKALTRIVAVVRHGDGGGTRIMVADKRRKLLTSTQHNSTYLQCATMSKISKL